MMPTSYIFVTMVANCIISATNAFTSSKIGPVLRSPSASLTSTCAYLDGLYYEPSFHVSKEKTAEVWELGLIRDESFDHTHEHISKCLVKLVGLSEYDAYETVRQARQNGVSLIEEFPLEIAEFYQEELTKLGIICELVPSEE
jgi:ATP-dependent Clp protease adapter protein ClpS